MNRDTNKEIEYNLVLEFKEINAPFPLCPICKQILFPDGFFVLNYKCRRCMKNFEQSVKNGKWAEVKEPSLLDTVRKEERKRTLEEVEEYNCTHEGKACRGDFQYIPLEIIKKLLKQ